MNSKTTFFGIIAFALLQLTGCGGGSAGSGTVISAVQIASLAPAIGDSTPAKIIIGGSGTDTFVTFGSEELDRTTSDGNTSIDTLGNTILPPFTVNYMVNDANPGTPAKGVIVLMSGGYMNTRLDGNGLVSSVFFSRSADLFAKQGYRVVTIEYASDFEFYFPDPLIPGISYDPQNPTANDPNEEANYTWYDRYRASTDHSSDLIEVINTANIDDLPVILVGYGRGVISAAANSDLRDGIWSVEAIVMLSPATTGGRAFLSGNPIPTDTTFDIPVFITYHSEDSCIAKEGPNSDVSPVTVINRLRKNLLENGNIFEIIAVAGGFESPEPIIPADQNDPYEACAPLTHHGLLGIEAGTVGVITDWIDEQLGYSL